jgi:hypothetical protein
MNATMSQGLQPIITPTTIELQSFLKGVKRDKSQYVEIKDERHFDNWQRSFLAMTRAHHIEEVFDHDYIPSTVKEKLLFDEKQKFAYTVLDSVLKTDMGKMLVWKYQHTFDAQRIWRDFIADAKCSTKAQISSLEILEWITAAKYNNTWKGTAHVFFCTGLIKSKSMKVTYLSC